MNQKDLILLERKIAIGMIASTEYLKSAKNIIELKWVQSKEAQMIMGWCIDFHKKYRKAPKSEIQNIFLEKMRTTSIQKNKGLLIEEILESLSDELEEENVFNVPYLVDQTVTYAKVCKLNGYAENIQEEVQNGNILEAELLVSQYQSPEQITSKAITPLKTVQQNKDAFENTTNPLLRYPGDLGHMLNMNMTREGFVCFMGQNKVGKTQALSDAMFRGAAQGKNVLFVQCGDLSENQMNRRNAIYLAKKSDQEQYCGKLLIPIMDCIHNQTGECDLPQREKDSHGPLSSFDEKYIRNDLKYSELKEAFDEFPAHVPCYNCKRNAQLPSKYFKGGIWYRERPRVEPLGWKESYHLIKKKYSKLMDKIRLITYPSDTLTMSALNAETDLLDKQGFTPDIVIIDYIELMAPDYDTKMLATRDQKNMKWKRGRRYSQERKILLLTADQSDAQGFKKTFLGKDNFSEDRRILDHVTFMAGLNVTTEEKKKGIMRINDIVSRETEGTGYVHVMQRLQIGRPVLGSFY